MPRVFAFVFLVFLPGNLLAQDRPVNVVREIYSKDLNLTSIPGMTFSSKANAFFVMSPNSELVLMNLYEDIVQTAKLPSGTLQPKEIAADWKTGALVGLNLSAAELVETPPGANGVPNASQSAQRRYSIGRLGLAGAAGLSFDPVSGDLLILDPSVPQIVRLKPDPSARFSSEALGKSGAISYISLSGLQGNKLTGLAVEPGTGNLYVLDSGEAKVWALSPTGLLKDVFELAPLKLRDPHSLTFAQSGDPTDKDTALSLYVVDTTLAGSRITEFSTTPVVQVAATPQQPVLVNTIQTSSWNPPSPDPSGVAYLPGVGRLLAVDGEVDEMSIFNDANVFETALGGTLFDAYDLTGITREPAGVAWNANNGRFFVSDDNRDRIYQIDPGGDGFLGTPDDQTTSFNTRNFNSTDPEGLGFDSGRGTLYVADGTGSEIYIVDPGNNGVFDGAPPEGDDHVNNFDTAALGLLDPEGVEYDDVNNSLYIVSTKRVLIETTTSGSLIRNIGINFASKPSGIAIAPGSSNSTARNLYLSDRAVDNGVDPNENDGKIYEIGFQDQPPPPPTTNLLANPDFELDANGDGRPDSWSTNTHVTITGTVVQNGSFSMRHLATDNSTYTITQVVSGIVAGQGYSFNGWVNIPVTSDTFTFKLQVQWQTSSGSNISNINMKTFKGTTPGWTQVNATLTAPSSAARARFKMVVDNLNATVYVDNFDFH